MKVRSLDSSFRLSPVRMLSVILTAAVFFAFPAIVSPEVFVHDQIVNPGEEAMLQAETKGVYFAKGGQMVEFSRDGRSLGSVLSGGDGVAYKPHVFGATGFFKIGAKSKKERGTGRVLSLKKGSSVVCIDIEGSLLAAPFSKDPVNKSRDAIRKIVKKYPVVYLHTGMLGIRSVKQWLAKNSFPESVVLTWDMGGAFKEIQKKGIRIRAVIGSQVFIDSGKEYAAKAFSFDETDDAEHVRDWGEIEKKLLGKP